MPKNSKLSPIQEAVKKFTENMQYGWSEISLFGGWSEEAVILQKKYREFVEKMEVYNQLLEKAKRKNKGRMDGKYQELSLQMRLYKGQITKNGVSNKSAERTKVKKKLQGFINTMKDYTQTLQPPQQRRRQIRDDHKERSFQSSTSSYTTSSESEQQQAQQQAQQRRTDFETIMDMLEHLLGEEDNRSQMTPSLQKIYDKLLKIKNSTRSITPTLLQRARQLQIDIEGILEGSSSDDSDSDDGKEEEVDYDISNLTNENLDEDQQEQVQRMIDAHNNGERRGHPHRGVGGVVTRDLGNFDGTGGGRGNWRLQFHPNGTLTVVDHNNRPY